jgi:hypothetical protein
VIPAPTIQEFCVRTVRVPMEEPHRTAAALGPTADLIRNIEPLLKGEPLAPLEIEARLALARCDATSLVRLQGGIENPPRAYGAVGFNCVGVPRLGCGAGGEWDEQAIGRCAA